MKGQKTDGKDRIYHCLIAEDRLAGMYGKYFRNQPHRRKDDDIHFGYPGTRTSAGKDRATAYVVQRLPADENFTQEKAGAQPPVET